MADSQPNAEGGRKRVGESPTRSSRNIGNRAKIMLVWVPTRRKPGRHPNKHYFSTVADYSAPWYTYLVGVFIALGMLGFINLLAYGYVQGWWA